MSDEATSTPAPEAIEPTAEASAEETSTETAEEGEGESPATPPPKETKAEAAAKKKYALKVNNQMREVELDINDDSQVQKYLQKALAADQKFEEAATVRKQAEQLLQVIKTNPLAILTHPDIGVDVKALAQQVLNDELEDMKKSPEQKRIEELEKALKSKEDREKQLEEEKRQAEMARIQEEAYQQLDDQISTALAKTELPKSAYVVKRITDAMIDAVNMGYADVTVEQIMPFVEQQMVEEFQKMFDEAPEQTATKLMEKFVGKKNMTKYRATKVEKMKKAAAASTKVVDTGAKGKPEAKAAEKIPFKKMFGNF